MEIDSKLTQITGSFVLCSESGDYTFNDDSEIVKHPNGKPVLSNPETVYYESSAGEGKAKYWTDDLSKAHVFTSIDDAVSVLLSTHSTDFTSVIRQLVK